MPSTHGIGNKCCCCCYRGSIWKSSKLSQNGRPPPPPPPPSQLIINDQPLVVIIMYYLLNLLLSDQAAWKCVWSANSSYNCYTWPFIISISFGVWSCCSRWHWATATWKTQGNICWTADNRSQNRSLKTKAKD